MKYRRSHRILITTIFLLTLFFIVLRFSNIVHVSDSTIALLVGLEILLVVIEIPILIATLGYYYGLRRKEGMAKVDALYQAQVDELKLASLPNWFIRPLTRLMRFEAKIVQTLARKITQLFRRLRA